jgi:anti-sigma B factor antagonist
VAFDSDQAENGRVVRARDAVDGAPHLELRDEADGPRHVLVLSGELDMASSPVLEDAVRAICTDSAETLTVDLSGLTFMDSTGLRVVLLAKELCESHHCELLVVPGPAQIQRLFEVTGILERLPFSS